LNIWETLRQPSSQPSKKGIWQELLAKTNLSSYIPQKIDLIEESKLQSRRSGSYFVVKNRNKVKYLKLTDQDYFLWQKMDGTRSFGDLVMAYFQKFGSFAFNRVSSLLDQLRSNHFLQEQPVQIFSRLARQKERKSFSGKMTQLVRSFLQKEVPFSRLDELVSFLYKGLFWPFFTQGAKVSYLILSVVGFACFVHVFPLGSSHMSVVSTKKAGIPM